MLKVMIAAVAGLMMTGAAMAQAEITSGQWQLLAVDGKRMQAEASFSIDSDGKITGRAACNRFFGQNEAELPKLSLPNLGATRMMCDRMAEEDALFQTLSVVDRAELREGHLLLLGPQGRVVEWVRDRDDKGLYCLTCSDL